MRKIGLTTGVLLMSTTMGQSLTVSANADATQSGIVKVASAKKFPDVRNFEKEIEYLVGKGIIHGHTDGTFKPLDNLKRIHAVQMVLREMGITKLDAPNPGFSDMKPGSYGYDEVAKAVQLGFIHGSKNAKGQKVFNPNGTLTRGEMAKILTEAYEITKDNEVTFTDVSARHWTKEYVSRLATANITVGYPDGSFKPDDVIQRQHFSAFMARMLNADFIPANGAIVTETNPPAPAPTPVVSTEVKTYTTTANLNLRSGASTSHGILLSIPKGKTVKFISEASSGWYQVDYEGKKGYVSSAYLQLSVPMMYKTTSYPISLQDMASLQFKLNAQTDRYRSQQAYVKKEYLELEEKTEDIGVLTVNAPVVNADTKHTFGVLRKDAKVTIIGETTFYYQINYQVWRNAKAVDITTQVDPRNFAKGTTEYYQFLDLSESAKVTATEMNKVVNGKGILNGKGKAFIDAGKQHGVNEVYLVSHALLETGHGTSELATGVTVSEVDGVKVEPKTVYNMFGIGAYDATALKSGSERAYKEGWTTPEKAIIGGAKFIGEMYVNHPTYKQNTLYKMRWNPANPGKHQYATDIGWAVKQTKTIDALYKSLSNYSLTFDVPVYN